MGSANPPSAEPPPGQRRFASFAGLFFDEFDPTTAWIRETGVIRLPGVDLKGRLILRGRRRAHPDATGTAGGFPSLHVGLNGQPAATLAPAAGETWELELPLPSAASHELELRLGGVGFVNALAWLGRVTGFGPLQRFRGQPKNRQVRIASLHTGDGETIFDFSRRDAPYSPAFARKHANLGLNIVGFLTADLGLGESARCMVRAADASAIPAALVPLKVNCRNRLGDDTYAPRLQDTNPHPVNVIHVDPPASRDLDHHHGRGFRAGKYNIGYFAWELPEFPDAWVPSFAYYDEIWCPSDFTAAAIREKSPLPVLTMPHAIGFAEPTGSVAAWRARFGLPAEAFLFLTLFDLNSYSARKNPRAAIDAFRRAGLPVVRERRDGAALVVKVQNAAANPADFAALQASVADLDGTVLITETLSRADVYALQAACDCLVSLHRSEGFGLAVAESMYLGKPVISTDWSATAEFVSPTNGCPVRARLVTLEENHGPYAKGSTWAEPDPAHAAEHMQRLYRDRDLATRLGASARATMRERFSPAAIGRRYRRRLESIAMW